MLPRQRGGVEGNWQFAVHRNADYRHHNYHDDHDELFDCRGGQASPIQQPFRIHGAIHQHLDHDQHPDHDQHHDPRCRPEPRAGRIRASRPVHQRKSARSEPGQLGQLPAVNLA